MVSEERVRTVNDAPVKDAGAFVLYWMTSQRRLGWNFALERALEHCRELDKPLLVLEPLRVGYRWASRRFHDFVVDGMVEHAEQMAASDIAYHPYVERRQGEGSGLLERLAADAAVVVGDDYPCFFLPRMLAAAGARLEVRLEAVDSNGLLPMRRAGKLFSRAVDLRRHLQAELGPYLLDLPEELPLADAGYARGATVPEAVRVRWPALPASRTERESLLAALPIDQEVGRTDRGGGEASGRQQLQTFLDERLGHYGESRNQPEREVTSGLSPYLHFGHVSVHEVFYALSRREEWNPSRLADFSTGKRRGWWGMSEAAESFLDELVTWRELGLNFCVERPESYAEYDALPEWSRRTLAEHAGDARPHLYDLEEFAAAATHDPIWNAAQTELRERGVIHNYLRMLWGKKILHWSASAEEALAIMIELNNRYALDGRDPNSYSGIFWVLGRYDRAWGPEREVFGKVRYMSSANTRRKMRLDAYLERWSR